VRRDLVMLGAHDARVAARTECSSPSFAEKGTEEAVPVEMPEPLLPWVGLTPAPSDSIEGYMGVGPPSRSGFLLLDPERVFYYPAITPERRWSDDKF
jgi:hypothetical protein